jgi:hypothetical protein
MNIGLNTYQTTSYNTNNTNTKKEDTSSEKEELTLEEEINKSAVEVSISVGAQLILATMEAEDKTSENTNAQKDILDFLAGKEVSDDFKLSNTGYEGKPISELSTSEAEDLISEDGFFGVNKTSQRVADLAFKISGDDIQKLEASREGVVKGFDDAAKMWGGELPEISYKTQERTLELIDKRIAELKSLEE